MIVNPDEDIYSTVYMKLPVNTEKQEPTENQRNTKYRNITVGP